MAHFDTIVTTPHILTETSNLLGQMTGTLRDRCFGLFGQIVERLDERNLPARLLTDTAPFIRSD